MVKFQRAAVDCVVVMVPPTPPSPASCPALQIAPITGAPCRAATQPCAWEVAGAPTTEPQRITAHTSRLSFCIQNPPVILNCRWMPVLGEPTEGNCRRGANLCQGQSRK